MIQILVGISSAASCLSATPFRRLELIGSAVSPDPIIMKAFLFVLSLLSLESFVPFQRRTQMATMQDC